MIDRNRFFADGAVLSLFHGDFSPGQAAGTNAIFDEWEHRALEDRRWLAYMLATAFHETARTMQAIAEYGLGHGYAYGVPDPETGHTYYGRGLVQLTWKRNYEAMGKLLHVDLVGHPERALELPIAVQILFEGMKLGTFTGVGLGTYFNQVKDDPVNARRIINGTDKAEMIAGYHRVFLAALTT